MILIERFKRLLPLALGYLLAVLATFWVGFQFNLACGQITDWRFMGFCVAMYLAIGIPVHFILGLIGTAIGLLIWLARPRLLRPIAKASWTFTISLFMCGLLFNIIWTMFVFGHLYTSWDYIGIDCNPFGLNIDIGQYFHGMSEGRIRTLWVGYAALSWASAVGITRFFMKQSGTTPTIETPVGRVGIPAPQAGRSATR
jgi:hypothetical protein